jgi:hypothetical protein
MLTRTRLARYEGYGGRWWCCWSRSSGPRLPLRRGRRAGGCPASATLGAAGLHPSLGRTRYRPARRYGTLSRGRMVLAVVLVVVVPIAWWFEIQGAARGRYNVVSFSGNGA